MFRQNSQARTSSVRSKIYQLAEALKICGAPCTLHIWDVQSLGLLGIVNQSQQKKNEIKNALDPITQNLILPEESSPDQQILPPPAAECGADTHTHKYLCTYICHMKDTQCA